MTSFYKENFFQAIKAQRSQMTPKQRAKSRIQKKKVILYPYARERAYAKFIGNNLLQPLTGRLFSLLTKENYERWIKDYQKHDALTQDQDAYPDELAVLIGSLRNEIDDTDLRQIKEELNKTSSDVFQMGKREWMKQTEGVVGYPYVTDEKWWPKTQKAWENENLTLITSIPEEYIKNVNDLLYRGIRNGELWGDLKEKLMKVDDKLSANRAELIARDQVGKLNGQLSKYRQTELSINMYTWETANDERVRGRPGGKYEDADISHWALQGKVCRWDDNTVMSEDNGKTWIPRPAGSFIGIPGEDIQCRCQAAAFFPEMLDEVDSVLDSESSGAESDAFSLANPKEYEDYVSSHYMAELQPLLQIQEDNPLVMMKQYQNSYFTPLRKVLTGEMDNTPEMQKRIEVMTNYIKAHSLKDPLRLYRGLAVDADSSLLALKTGSTFKMEAFSSFSTTLDEAVSTAGSRTSGKFGKEKQVVINLLGKKGDELAPLATIKEGKIELNGMAENEFLGRPGLKFTVLETRDADGVHYIKVKVAK